MRSNSMPLPDAPVRKVANHRELERLLRLASRLQASAGADPIKRQPNALKRARHAAGGGTRPR
jgi:hypothetical protein